ncbi:hypothetical protein GCM10020218_012770 [Dactylosporangium vinaceum]
MEAYPGSSPGSGATIARRVAGSDTNSPSPSSTWRATPVAPDVRSCTAAVNSGDNVDALMLAPCAQMPKNG